MNVESHKDQQILKWLEMILVERFGHNFNIQCSSEYYLSLQIDGLQEEILILVISSLYHPTDSSFPCQFWDPVSEGFLPISETPLPMPGSDVLSTPLIQREDGAIKIQYDVLGLVYWMLTRQEEIDRTDLDQHDRFPAKSSHAYCYQYLDRPIIDEWLYILEQIICQTWPTIKLNKPSFKMTLSHDVDLPSQYGFLSFGKLLHKMAQDVIYHGNVINAARAPYIRLKTTNALCQTDPYNTFDWIMDESEKRGLQSNFYFIAGNTHKKADADYDITDKAIRTLLKSIYQRGHRIGLHPSYNTYLHKDIIKNEFHRLKSVCSSEGIEQQNWGVRMHFLRWKSPETLQFLNDAEFNYDTTLGYADSPGFRCGTCHEFPAFDVNNGQILQIRIKPLIAMESTVLEPHYLGLSGEQAYEKFISLKRKCESVDGNFTLLWHNSRLVRNDDRSLYISII